MKSFKQYLFESRDGYWDEDIYQKYTGKKSNTLKEPGFYVISKSTDTVEGGPYKAQKTCKDCISDLVEMEGYPRSEYKIIEIK